jgi:hypothetical protein
MAQFYSTIVPPSRNPVTRCGHKPRGIEATVQSWQHIFLLQAYHSLRDGDSLRILYAPKGDSPFPSHRIVLLDEPMALIAEKCGSLPGRLIIR